jgi:hypothetical protein
VESRNCSSSRRSKSSRRAPLSFPRKKLNSDLNRRRRAQNRRFIRGMWIKTLEAAILCLATHPAIGECPKSMLLPTQASSLTNKMRVGIC